MKPPDEISIDEAMRLLPAAKPTTLDRMRDAAANEAARIESSQLSRIVAGLIEKPIEAQIALRDDFFGLAQLIDLILGDQVLLDRIKERRARAKAQAPAPVAGGEEEFSAP